MEKATKIELPVNRIIRKRIAARTIGVHLCALPPELQALNDATKSAYLAKHDLPDEICLALSDGDMKFLSRDEAWKLADELGERLEWDMLPETLSGKATALLSSTGQGVYADYGRPCVDFSGFAHDGIISSSQQTKSVIASQGVNSSVMLGPLLIAVDTASAAGLTALGHKTRGARLTDKTVLSDVASTGVFEGSMSWASAKLGVFTGAKAMRLTALLPIPGARLASIPIGIVVGLTTVVASKRFANKCKDAAIDAAQKPVALPQVSDSIGKVITA